MQNIFEILTPKFRKNKGVLSKESVYSIIEKHTTLSENAEIILLLLQASGYPIIESEDNIIFKPMHTDYQVQEYVIVDIETNGSKPERSQVIEIGAIKVKNGEIIDKLETFVACTYLPDNIAELTGINLNDLIDAPSRKKALMMLKEFMSDAIFVAHNVAFDYTFLSASFKRFGLGCIGNMRICTIELAKRTIQSPKYGLAGLCETLNLELVSHHRAYYDALCSWKIMQVSLNRLPKYIKTSDDLIKFSISSKKEKKAKEAKLLSSKKI